MIFNGRSVLTVLALFSVSMLAAGSIAFSDLYSREDLAELSETCIACHDDMPATLIGTTHELTSPDENSVIDLFCVGCHDNGPVHIEDPTPENIGNPARQPAATARLVCSRCHAPHHQTATAGFDPHIGQDISCVECHAVHGGNEKQLIDEEAGFCGECHIAVVNRFRARSNHPLTDWAVTCLDCHNVAGDIDIGFGHGIDASCARCHPENSGPYMYEHEATSSFVTEDGGCISCHRPHGSANERLLNQPGDGLCRQCHGVPPRHNIQHGGIGSRYACVECHRQIHGSYDNSAFLDPMMDIKIGDQAGSCYCHYIDDYRGDD
jgi:DmsE family decaheme c-type cytochrome